MSNPSHDEQLPSPATAEPRRRTRVEPNIYTRINAAGKEVFEIGYRDSAGKQRWTTVDGMSVRGQYKAATLSDARRKRDALIGHKADGRAVSANPRQRFGDTADDWLSGPVSALRPATVSIYRNAVDNHLRARWGRMRLDAIHGRDVGKLVKELRDSGLSEWTIRGVVGAASRVFRHARIHDGWLGIDPTTLLTNGERPTTGETPRRRIYRGDELRQTLEAAREPTRLLFALAATTGARLSELLGLTWADLELSDTDSAEVRIEAQVDRSGQRRPLKTAESRRTIELPASLATHLKRHQLSSGVPAPSAFVFATRSGRPLAQRNALRALREAQARAVDDEGKPTFPALVEALQAAAEARRKDPNAKPKIPGDAAPNFHGFRHSAASLALSKGESAEEVSWQLGHKNSVVTRAIYVQEIRTVERQARRRSRMESQYADALTALDSPPPARQPAPTAADVRELAARTKP